MPAQLSHPTCPALSSHLPCPAPPLLLHRKLPASSEQELVEMGYRDYLQVGGACHYSLTACTVCAALCQEEEGHPACSCGSL